MHRKTLPMILFALLAVSACQKAADALTETSSSSKAMKKIVVSSAASSAAITIDAASAPAVTGVYAMYREGVIGNGETSVLFFHASWCPECKEADRTLTQWYGSSGFPITVYKVDYDSSADLKSRYGILYQHTFVKIDGEGNMIEKVQGPSDAVLKKMLQK